MRAVLIAVVVAAALASSAGSVRAQTWGSGRSDPTLWQITSIDRTGELLWPYGTEDVAGDGTLAFLPDEAGADIRSVYADADAERLWLRAYVAAITSPGATVVTFFFINTDARTDTGGPADGDALEPTLGDDPTRGGYERALGVRGDGTALGAWQWSAEQRVWLPLAPRPTGFRTEAGRAGDPLAIGALVHGYAQVDAEHAISGLDASCGGTIFVRTRNVAPAPRVFGDDDDDGAVACQMPTDAYGDPVVLRSFTCRADAECPSNGRCREGVCLFAYECTAAADCPAGTPCSVGRCVQAVDRTCTTNGDCSGLVCDSGACVPCLEVGPRTCAAGLACSPNGRCVDPGAFEPGRAGSREGKVQGGAFSCSALSEGRSRWSVLWTLLALLWLSRRRLRQRPERARTTHGEGRQS